LEIKIIKCSVRNIRRWRADMAKPVMIQGTMSGAGKSLLAAGLCRIFYQDGYSVAPFKSQNMALNSFITEEGLEMGRAQVVQAEAAYIKPSVDMNPVLLKPSSDTGSQVIVNGVPAGMMTAEEYYQVKKKFIPDIMEAYHSLERKYDIIVIEGAGSPAEINLKENDIVNMGMAKMADSPVVLTGDIDRGGVFAQLLGTAWLLEEEERERIKGLIINKFRGDKKILAPGITMLEERCGKKVLGVIPYMDIDIDDEDSLSERLCQNNSSGLIDMAVIKLPRISNFTDFNIFENFPEVSLRYVKDISQFGNPDIIFLPGTKNTIMDLLWLRQNGLEAKIKQHVAAGGAVFGICGGYQMLGESISDPEGVEHKGTVNGLGLLSINTVFENEKTRTQVQGKFKKTGGILGGLSGNCITGYEIHMGSSFINTDGKAEALAGINAASGKDFLYKPDGAWHGNVYGSYVHGIFNSPGIAKLVVELLLKAKGIDGSSVKTFDMKKHKEEQYNMLADGIRQALDMEKVYKIVFKNRG